MPPIPPISGIAGAFGSGISATTASVVKNRAATDAAFCNAERVTFAALSSVQTYFPFTIIGQLPLPNKFLHFLL